MIFGTKVTELVEHWHGEKFVLLKLTQSDGISAYMVTLPWLSWDKSLILTIEWFCLIRSVSVFIVVKDDIITLPVDVGPADTRRMLNDCDCNDAKLVPESLVTIAQMFGAAVNAEV